MLGQIARLDDADDFAPYGVTPTYIADLRERVVAWRIELLEK